MNVSGRSNAWIAARVAVAGWRYCAVAAAVVVLAFPLRAVGFYPDSLGVWFQCAAAVVVYLAWLATATVELAIRRNVEQARK